MRLDQVIVAHLVQVLATIHATGKLCARRMVLQGEHVDAYLAGYQDALQAVAGALGIADALNDAGMITIEGAATMPSLSIATANTGTQHSRQTASARSPSVSRQVARVERSPRSSRSNRRRSKHTGARSTVRLA